MANTRLHERNGRTASNGANGTHRARKRPTASEQLPSPAGNGVEGPEGVPSVSGTAPSATGDNGASPAAGRDAGGRFGAGNKAAKGNPFYRRLCQMRQAVLEEVGEEGLRKLARK